MRWQINNIVDENSFDYFEKTLITDNGFREYDVRWKLGQEINPNGFVVLGRAYGTFVREFLKEEKLVVGHDFRYYSQDLCRSFIIGLLSTGVHVADIGLTLTPLLYFAQYQFNTRGGAMVTASHNENGWTGIKLADGLSSTFGPDGVTKFKELVKQGNFCTGNGSYEICDDIFEKYTDDILGAGKLKRQLKLVLAAGNGTAGRFAPGIMKALGCEVIELDCNGDWNFPNHNPNPEDISFLEKIKEKTLENKADLGIGLDGDGDRIGVVDNKGREVFSDKLGLVLARWLCPKHPGRSVVIDVKSTGLFYGDPVLRKADAKVMTWKTGHSYIKEKVAEINAIAGFEKSGHWFFNKPIGRGYDDAVLSSAMVLRFLDETGVSLSDSIDSLPKTWQSPTLGVYCSDHEKYDVVEQVSEQYLDEYNAGTLIAGSRIKDIITVNGIRFVLENDSWGLVRASSNKPSLVLVAESPHSEDELYSIMEHIQKRVGDTGKVGEYDQKMPPRSDI